MIGSVSRRRNSHLTDRLRTARFPHSLFPTNNNGNNFREFRSASRHGSKRSPAKADSGTGLLLAGRVLSVAVTALTQVLIVRSLSTHDYGAWAYALSVVLLWQTLSSFGFQEAIPRFVSFYHECKDYPRLFGTMLLAVGSIILSGALVIAIFFISPGKLLALVHEEKQSLAVLSILICMVPVEALDGVLIGLFATLASPRSIFFRRHVLAPLLRLAVVLLLIALKTNVVFLAYGYLASSVLGMLVCGGILVRHMKRDGLLAHFQPQGNSFTCA